MKFNHLNVPSHWQHYWTRFPEGHTILEALIQWVSQVDEMVDNQNNLSDTVSNYGTRLDQFIDQFDGHLSDEVKNTLGEWQKSGFLDVVINEALKTKYHEMDNRLSADIGRLETYKMDKDGIEQIDYSNFNQSTKEMLANISENGFPVVGANSVSTSHVMNNSISNNKLSLPIEGLTTKTLVFSLDSSKNRAITAEQFLEEGYEIQVNGDVEFSVWKKETNGDETGITEGGWQKSFVIPKTDNYIFKARFGNNQELSENDINTIGNNIYITTPNTAIQAKKFHEYVSPTLTFEPGGLAGNGELDDSIAGRYTRARNRDYFKVEAGTILKIKHPDITRFAIDVEGEPIFMKVDGQTWVKRDVKFDTTINIRIMQSFDDNREVFKEILFLKNNMELVRPTDLVRASDLNYFIEKEEFADLGDFNLYPPIPVWGYEYMYSWYDKLRKNEPVKMTWAGDSTTFNSNLIEEYKRHELGKKLLTLAGYDESLITSINAGHGAQHSGNWLGGDKDEDKWTPKGFLDEDMQENPDLYIFSYGFNDGSSSHFPGLTWEERISRFEENLNEGLERIRGSQYNKSPDDMGIILTTPIAGYDEGRGNTPQVWNNKIRPIIQKACREYYCAFVDITARQYDHGFSSSWSTDGDFVHPNETANVDYMSMFDELIIPRLLHK